MKLENKARIAAVLAVPTLILAASCGAQAPGDVGDPQELASSCPADATFAEYIGYDVSPRGPSR